MAKITAKRDGVAPVGAAPKEASVKLAAPERVAAFRTGLSRAHAQRALHRLIRELRA